MFDSDNKLRHLAFFEELATTPEGGPDWRSAMAGLVTLRLVDSWLEDDTAVAAADGTSLPAVAEVVGAIDDGNPARTLLERVATALQEQRPDIHVVVTPLLAYGQLLEYDAKWHLATDVYHTVLAHLHPSQDSDASITAHIRLGQCYRNLVQLDEADSAFRAAATIANSVDDMVGVLRARIGEARIAEVRGNLPKAEQILDETIQRSAGEQFADVHSRALHDRATVANARGQYELAIQLAYQALEKSQVPSERDRILSDLGEVFLNLGVYSAARDAYLVLSVTAREQYVRWAATLNLLEIASLTGAETLFDLYRRELNTQSLPPRMYAALQLSVGQGYQRFGNLELAQSHLERALAAAAEHGLNRYIFEAEAALQALEKPAPPLHVPAGIPAGVEKVAGAIRDLRETVGVG